MTKPNKAADFLQNMRLTAQAPPTPVAQPEQGVPKAKKQAPTRAGLKHIGGYFGLETVEKVALLRARLGLDNSELIKLAIDELHRKHLAKRAFGDA
ncbi:MAG TPA: hypothetical protein VN822_06215 [Candidatus Acidoferrales bacterium]|nr:hypothetical protein [Candidatus Acidoferrales bacterium]